MTQNSASPTAGSLPREDGESDIHSSAWPARSRDREKGATESGLLPDETPQASGRSGAQLPICSASQALFAAAPCRVPVPGGGYFIHDEERPDRLYAEGLLPTRR